MKFKNTTFSRGLHDFSSYYQVLPGDLRNAALILYINGILNSAAVPHQPISFTLIKTRCYASTAREKWRDSALCTGRTALSSCGHKMALLPLWPHSTGPSEAAAGRTAPGSHSTGGMAPAKQRGQMWSGNAFSCLCSSRLNVVRR